MCTLILAFDLTVLSVPAAESKRSQPNAQKTIPSTPAGKVIERSLGPIPGTGALPKLTGCCELTRNTFTPGSWEGYNFCHGCVTFRRFIRPMDEDSFFRSTRLAVDNLTHFRSNHYLLPNQSLDHLTLSYVFKPFGSTTERYFQSRLHNGVFVYESAFGVVDFNSEEDALSAFHTFQGRRIRGEKAHWRLEFLDPDDETLGDRLPAIHSEPPLKLMRRLDVVSDESERIRTSHPPSLPESARAFETSVKQRMRQSERVDPYRPRMKLDERRGGVSAALLSAVNTNIDLAQT